jgi:hypothetical protein
MIDGRHVSAETFRDTLVHQGFTMVEVVDATASGSGAAEVRMRSHAAARAEGLAVRITRAGGIAPPAPAVEPGVIGPATPVRFVIDGRELPPGEIHSGRVPRDFVRFEVTANAVPEARMTSAAAYHRESIAQRRALALGS